MMRILENFVFPAHGLHHWPGVEAETSILSNLQILSHLFLTGKSHGSSDQSHFGCQKPKRKWQWGKTARENCIVFQIWFPQGIFTSICGCIAAVSMYKLLNLGHAWCGGHLCRSTYWTLLPIGLQQAADAVPLSLKALILATTDSGR